MGIVKFNVLMQCLNGYLKYAFYFEQMQMTNQPHCAHFDLCHFTFTHYFLLYNRPRATITQARVKLNDENISKKINSFYCNK
jgi:hypothetical protein